MAFGPLADAYDPAGMDDAEKRAVALAGLREGQSRRSLAAKAWIKRGDMLEALGRYEEALAAYKKVSRDFSQEPHLAEQAWVRQALLAQTDARGGCQLGCVSLCGRAGRTAGFSGADAGRVDELVV